MLSGKENVVERGRPLNTQSLNTNTTQKWEKYPSPK
jgi:hypothetical protein